MGSIFQTGPAMGNLFAAAPQLLGQVRLAADDSQPAFYGDRDEDRLYCDPSVDPLCPYPYEGPMPVILGDHSFRATDTYRESPPNEKCNVAWDPGCPRQQPSMTMVPYVPSSYLRGSQPIQIGGIEYVAPAIGRTALRQRRQF